MRFFSRSPSTIHSGGTIMAHIEKWIWLSPEKYPGNQTTRYSAEGKIPMPGNYTVAEFKKDYSFDAKVVKAELRFSGDTSYVLYLNDEVLATGPINVGGDFLFNDEPRSRHYATEMTVYPDSDALHFFARCLDFSGTSVFLWYVCRIRRAVAFKYRFI